MEGVKRVLKPEMKAKDQVLVLLHHSTGWVSASELFQWIEYSTLSNLRRVVLVPLHKVRLIEFDAKQDRARISPTGSKLVEDLLRANA